MALTTHNGDLATQTDTLKQENYPSVGGSLDFEALKNPSFKSPWCILTYIYNL